MKLVSFLYQHNRAFGAATENGVIDFSKKLGHKYNDLRTFLEKDGLSDQEATALVLEGKADYTFAQIEFLPVIPNPEKIFCVGVNYDEHRRETGMAETVNPTIFSRYAQSQIGHEQFLILPPESEWFDFEGEIAVIIKKFGRRIPEEEAMEYVAGYSCYNDGSIRDWQMHTTQWIPGKNFEGTGAFGPYLVTVDEVPSDEPLVIETRLNGEVMQHSSTDLLINSIPRLIHYISTFITLNPGDVIVTGTPGGVGFKRNPQVLLKEGDVVEVEVSHVGILRNQVKREREPDQNPNI